MNRLILAALSFAPALASAQDLGNLNDLLKAIGDLVELALPIVVAIALLVFFWGLVRYIFAGADDSKAAGKTLMIWGIVALFVMVSVWGLVRFIGDAFDIEQGGSVDVPEVPIP